MGLLKLKARFGYACRVVGGIAEMPFISVLTQQNKDVRLREFLFFQVKTDLSLFT